MPQGKDDLSPLNSYDDDKRKSLGRTWASDPKVAAKRRFPDFEPGTILGGLYQVKSVLGRGGMGVVYEVIHIPLKRRCAVKVLSAELISAANWQRFQSEARSIAGLSHPCLVNVYDLGIHNEHMPYYAMDLLQGMDLDTMIRTHGKLNIAFALEIMIQALDGLNYAHKHGVVHRDIKPANMLVVKDAKGASVVKLLDFGIAKLIGLEGEKNDPNKARANEEQKVTATGEIFGSPFYMSPEQCLGDPVDGRADIYSIGCTMFECLTGRVPFDGGSPLDTVMLHLDEPPPTMAEKAGRSFPPALEAVIAKCLAKDPDDRYDTANEMAEDLSLIAQGKEPKVMQMQNAVSDKESNKNSNKSAKGEKNRLQTDTGRRSETRDGGQNEGTGISLPFVAICATVALSAVLTIALGVSLIFSNEKNIPRAKGNNNLAREKGSMNQSSSQPLGGVEQGSRDTLGGADTQVVELLQSIKKNGKFRKRDLESQFPGEIIFEFPKDMTVGKLTYSSAPWIFDGDAALHARTELARLPEPFLCRGQLSVEKGLPLQFTMMQPVPNLGILSGFEGEDLSELILNRCDLSQPVSMDDLIKLKSLKSIDFRFCDLSDASLLRLNEMPKIIALDLADNPCTNQTIESLNCLKRLQKLRISADAFTDDLLKKLQGIDKIKSLHVHGVLSLDGLKLIAQTKSLKSLTLEVAVITPELLKILKEAKSLEKVEMEECITGTNNLEDFAFISHLHQLKMVRPVGIDTKSFAKIQKLMPATRVSLVSITEN